MADDGPRNAATNVIGVDTEIAHVKEILMTALHAIDVRLSNEIIIRVDSRDAALALDRQHARDEMTAMEARSVTRYANLNELSKQHDIAQQLAIDKVDAANEKRFASVNEFRAQLKDQAGTFVTRNEINAKFDSLTERIDRNDKTYGDALRPLQRVTDTNAGRTAILSVIGSAIVSIFVALIVALLLRKP